MKQRLPIYSSTRLLVCCRGLVCSKWFVCLVLLVYSSARLPVCSKEKVTLLGIGRSNQYDTYLSPLEYTGPQGTFMRVTQRPRALVSLQTVTLVQYSLTQNPAGTAREHAAQVSYDLGPRMSWPFILPGLRIDAGVLAGASVGGVYNTRNGNNPAQARVSARASLSVGGAYSLRLLRRRLSVRYQADIPVVGCMFSPQFGQSYYNIFTQGNWDHNVVLTHLGNAPSLRQTLTVTLPLLRRSLTVGYLRDAQQATPHSLRQHQYTRALLIGFTL